MSTDPVTPSSGEPQKGFFPTTHWSVVLRAGGGCSPLSEEALARLCETYRSPVLAYVKTSGLSHADAEDLTQGFFEQFLKRKLAGRVEPREGVKFRSFLLRCLINFLADQRDRSNALKRGGGKIDASLEEAVDQGKTIRQLVDESDAASLYEREWATALLSQVLDRLEGEYLARGRRSVFHRLQPLLLDRKGDRPYAKLAADLGITEGAVKKEVSRMRARYRVLFREEVAHTVTSPLEVDGEINHLFSVLTH